MEMWSKATPRLEMKAKLSTERKGDGVVEGKVTESGDEQTF